MKYIILAIVSIHLIFVDASLQKECRKETGVSWPSLRKLKAGDFSGNDDPKLKCYLRCVLIKHGILNKKNEIDLEKALQFVPENMQEKIRISFTTCYKSTPGLDQCDQVFQVTKCFFKLEPEVLQKASFFLV